MRRNIVRWIVVVSILALGFGGLVWFDLAGRLSAPALSNKLTVGATIFPLADIARQVGGEYITVALLIPPGVSEHSYSLTPQQLAGLQSARVIFQIGHGLEERLTERIAQTLPDTRLVTVDRGITLREKDPHYWLTVPNAEKIAMTMAEELQQLDPAHATQYQANLQRYRAELVALETELQTLGRNAPKKEFIAMHNAWSYFAAQYGWRLVATYEPVEGQEPSLNDLQHIQDLVRQYSLTTFYTEPQKASTAVTTFMQREFGLRVRTLDPVGGGPGRNSYAELMRFNMQALASGGS